MTLPPPRPARTRRLALAAAALALGIVGGLGIVVARGPEPGGPDEMWSLLFGPPDLGPVDFATLRRRSTPNDALICPADLCRSAKPDREPPVLPVEGERLRAIVREVAAAEPRTDLVFAARWDEQDRYVVRTALLRFPDTVNAEIVGRGVGASTVALYSRSQIGRSDLGVNGRRLARWLARIEAVARADSPREDPAPGRG